MSAVVATRARRRATRPVWEEKPTVIGRSAKALILTLLVLAVLFPMWSVLVTSLASRSTINEAGEDRSAIPANLSLQMLSEPAKAS